MSRAPAGTLSAAAEAVVVVLAAAGDDAAFTELVRRRQGWLRALLRRLCREPALADDLAQQAFILAWQKLPTLHKPAAFGGWLRSLAVNLWLQSLRSRHGARQLALTPQAEATLVVAPADVAAAIDLDRMLARLRPEERACVVLCHAEGMSHAEIARLTGWPLGTVKSHIARGLAQLRTALGEEA